ncbi:MAG: hypothetical protein SynsKO_20310 [Synoicihabitans sp.]
MSHEKSQTEFPLAARWTFVIFVLALGYHFFFATYNFTYGFMVGHEFRQTQTALITRTIDEQNNFGIYYETPILGKPWAFPLEFPFYQWVVVGVKRTLDLEYIEAARGVSLTCFYGMLPAVFLLLGSCGISLSRRWLIMALVLFAPVYIFYSRAFLIDPMAVVFSAWFLTGFVRAMNTRSWWWWSLAVVTGTIGILVKSLVFMVWLFPAALYGAWCLWRVFREGKGARAILGTIGFGVGAVVPPYIAITWWVGYTDAIKEVHRSAHIFTSKALTEGNFGTFSLASRIDPATWSVMGERWAEAILRPSLLLGVLAFGLIFCAQQRRYIVGALLVWIFGQLAFPYAYAYQDYYFYAGAVFVLLAIGFVVVGIVEKTSWPKVVRLGLLTLPFLFFGQAYLQGYFLQQRIKSFGGSGMTAFLRDRLPKQSIIMGIGHDWSAIVPYYAQRRALMVRQGLENEEYMKGAIEDLDGEFISAVVVSGPYRYNQDLIDSIVRLAEVTPYPLLRHHDDLVFVNPLIWSGLHQKLSSGELSYPNVEVVPLPAGVADHTLESFSLSKNAAKFAFPNFDPQPHRVSIQYGYGPIVLEDVEYYGFHPNSDLWIRPRKLKGKLAWSYGIIDQAWQREGDRSDGVDFIVSAESPNGSRREIYRDEVTPAENPADAGVQSGEIPYEVKPEETLVFSTRPRAHPSFDWAYIGNVIELESD